MKKKGLKSAVHVTVTFYLKLISYKFGGEMWNTYARHRLCGILQKNCNFKSLQRKETLTPEVLTLLYRKTPRMAVIIPKMLDVLTGFLSISNDILITMILFVALATA